MRRTVLGLLFAILLGIGTGGGATELTPEQEQLVDELTHQLMAPCCWTASVAEHGSGQAPVLEAEIRDAVAAGQTGPEILDFYVAKFGERILVEPRRSGFNVLAYWIPWVALVLGLLLIVSFVRKRRHVPVTAGAAASPSVDPYRRRVQEELERLES